MSRVDIEIDADDYADYISKATFKRELSRRLSIGEIKPSDFERDKAEPWTRAGLAEDIRHAFYARDASRMEALLRVLETVERAS
ncbi:MAG TPA: hypothetical protein PLB26_21485 [Rubrivivax sp.]|nr:hypothetical protein [Rubrivivax sp.]